MACATVKMAINVSVNVVRKDANVVRKTNVVKNANVVRNANVVSNADVVRKAILMKKQSKESKSDIIKS